MRWRREAWGVGREPCDAVTLGPMDHTQHASRPTPHGKNEDGRGREHAPPRPPCLLIPTPFVAFYFFATSTSSVETRANASPLPSVMATVVSLPSRRTVASSLSPDL